MFCVSACFEHSSDLAVRCCLVLAFWVFPLAAGVAVAAGVAAGAAGVWAMTGAELNETTAAKAKAQAQVWMIFMLASFSSWVARPDSGQIEPDSLNGM